MTTIVEPKKACRTCGEIKPFSDFRVHHRFKDGRDKDCKKCYNAYATKKRRLRPPREAPPEITCTRCYETLPSDNFGARKGGKYDKQSWCLDCFSDYNKTFRREKLRESITLKEKLCGRCEETLPTQVFSISLRSEDKLYMFCRDCEMAQRKKARELRGRVCTLCGTAKHTIDFGVNKGYKDGRDRRCLTCLAARAMVYKKRGASDGVTRQCRVCEVVKSIDDFQKHQQYRDGIATICLDCYKIQRRERKVKKLGIRLPASKYCSKCDTTKNSAHFHLDKNQRDGLRRWCGDCMNSYDRALYSARDGGEERSKPCSKCGEVLPYTSFYRRIRPDGSFTVRPECKDCSSAMSLLWREKRLTEQKYCVKCNTTKTIKDFSKDRTQRDGLHRLCKDCKNEREKERREAFNKAQALADLDAKMAPEPEPEPVLVHPVDGPRPTCPRCDDAFVRFDRYENCWQCRKCSMRFL